MTLRYGYVYPGGEARDAAEHARAAEEAGWDGFFVWDPVWGVDAWMTLAAAAVRTTRIRLGTMITPVSRRRPWTLAGQTATLDRLSGGRAILAVGLGAVDTGFTAFGEVVERKARAELLDEGLAIIAGLWRGQPFNFDGAHYHVKETTFMPPLPPVQSPRIPIWVVGAWPRPRSMARVARYDGWLPALMKDDGTFGTLTPDDVRAGRAWLDAHRPDGAPYDVIVEGDTSADDPAQAADRIAAFADAGVTWWLEAQWPLAETMFAPETQARIGARIRRGPPGVTG